MATKHPEISVSVESSGKDYRLPILGLQPCVARASHQRRLRTFAMRRCPARIGIAKNCSAVRSRLCRADLGAEGSETQGPGLRS
jgi:hypothetical protein